MQKFLTIHDRPANLCTAIDHAFNKLIRKTDSQWGIFNGSDEYYFGGIDASVLFIDMIRLAPSQKTFYFLDIGAGNFEWGRNLAKKINQLIDFDSDITVHIISLRGENNLNPVRTQFGQCVLHELGQFKIEELDMGLAKYLGKLNNKLDGIVTSWCLRHLADPVGTFVQSYNLLKPKGFFLFDGFFMQLDQGVDCKYFRCHMDALLFNTNSSFYRANDNDCRKLNVYVLQKETEMTLELALHYSGISHFENAQVGSETLSKYERLSDWKNLPMSDYSLHRVGGDQFTEVTVVTFNSKSKSLLHKLLPYILQEDYQKTFAYLLRSRHYLGLFEKTRNTKVEKLPDACDFTVDSLEALKMHRSTIMNGFSYESRKFTP